MADNKNDVANGFDELNKVLSGRGPFVYAFETATVPSSLKVGYTSRLVGTRLEEWSQYYKDLKEVCRSVARVDENTAFLDKEIHKFLMNMPEEYKEKRTSKGKIRNLKKDKTKKIFSNEFFENVNKKDFEHAIEDIRNAKAGKSPRSYHFFNLNKQNSVEEKFVRNQKFLLRDEQRSVVDRFEIAYDSAKKQCAADKGERKVYRKLLMYAVMRFGKTFTSLECAKRVNAKLIVVVSAKKDVASEWERQVKTHENYKHFIYLNYNQLRDEELQSGNNAIRNHIADGRTVVVSLTLQNLSIGLKKNNKAFKELCSQRIDLLIVDESHFGARGETLGKPIKDDDECWDGLYKRDMNKVRKGVGTLKSKVQLHLSGTPYRILMSNEFADEDIIGYFSSADLQRIQNEISDKLEKNGDVEWANPYFGFPQLVRFAYNFEEYKRSVSRKHKDDSISYSITEMMEPQSIEEDFQHSLNKKFIHEEKVKELLKVIDGSDEELEILGFLNYDKIKNGCMCRHMVWSLPYKASCDAMEALLTQNREKYTNLGDYIILNVGGWNNPVESDDAIKKIREYEGDNKKTITLTVDKMLTGVTVKEWDTILFMKDSQSPQEYDQAVFRVQNPYVVDVELENGTVVKVDKKPQTLLVDFDMNRMFRMQEKRSWFTSYDGDGNFSKCVEQEMKNSPMFVLNPKNVTRIEPNDVMEALKNYAKKSTLLEQANDIMPDESLLDNQAFRKMIESLNGLNTKKPFEMSKSNDGDGKDDDENEGGSGSKPSVANENAGTLKNLIQKMRTYYAKILFYAFLTDDSVKSLEEIIQSVSSKTNPSNSRIARALGLKREHLCMISMGHRGNVLDLDQKIYAINEKKNDVSLSPVERANAVVKDFSRLSESEVVTPNQIATQMVSLVPNTYGEGKNIIVDVASRRAEMACALCARFGTEKMKDCVHSFCMSALSYELTRKMYSLLGLNINNIHRIESRSNYIDEMKAYKPTVVLGSPAFKIDEEKSPYYHKIFEGVRDEIQPDIIVMMMKAVWYSGGKGLTDFRKEFLEDHRISVMHDYPDPKKCGMTSALRGGICFFLWNKNHDNQCEFHCHINDYDDCATRFLKTHLDEQLAGQEILLRYNQGIKILRKVLKKSKKQRLCTYEKYVTSRDPFGMGDKFKDYKENSTKTYCVPLYLAKGETGFVKLNSVKEKKYLNCVKVLVAKTSPGEDALPHWIISEPIVAEKGSVCTNSLYVVRKTKTRQQADNLKKYMQTKFFRFMMIMAKNGHNLTNETFRFVPDLNLDRSWTDEALYKYFDIKKSEQKYIEHLVKEWG